MAEINYNRLQVVLVEFGMAQLELAKELDVNRNSVSRWCLNKAQPSLNQLRIIAQFFRIDIRRLVEPTEWPGETGPSPFELFKERKKKDKEKELALKKKTAAKKAAKKTTRRK